MAARCKLLAVVAEADDADGSAVQSAPRLHTLYAPLPVFLRSKKLFGVIAALQHEIDAMLRKHRCASAARAGHGDPTCEYLRPRRAVQTRMIAKDPFERILAEQAGIHVAEQDRRVRVACFLLEQLLIIERHPDKFRRREHVPQCFHIFLVVPDSRNDLVDFRHTQSFLSDVRASLFDCPYHTIFHPFPASSHLLFRVLIRKTTDKL